MMVKKKRWLKWVLDESGKPQKDMPWGRDVRANFKARRALSVRDVKSA